MSLIEKHLFKAIHAAVLAGKEILEVYANDFAVYEKDDKSPLTEADKRSHEVISKFPGDAVPVLSEEGRSIPFEERKNWNVFWLIDPLDGTKEFVRRNGEFTVNIALIEKGKPIAGVIYAPVMNLLYFGSESTGSFRKNADMNELLTLTKDPGALIRSSEKLPCVKNEQFTVVASRSHLSKETEEYINKLKDQHDKINMVSKGSSLKLCLVAEGTADVYPRFAPTMEWDTAAGHAIAKFAGCTVQHAHTSEELIYNKADLLNPWFIVKSEK